MVRLHDEVTRDLDRSAAFRAARTLYNRGHGQALVIEAPVRDTAGLPALERAQRAGGDRRRESEIGVSVRRGDAVLDACGLGRAGDGGRDRLPG